MLKPITCGAIQLAMAVAIQTQPLASCFTSLQRVEACHQLPQLPLITSTTAQCSDNRQQLARGTIHIEMAIVMLNAAARVTIQLVMVIVIHKLGRSLDDSACEDESEVKRHPLVGRFKLQWLL